MDILQLLQVLKKYWPEVKWTLPAELKFGVLATNQAFILAKEQRRSPVEIAPELVSQIQNIATSESLPITAEAAGPYVNLQLTDSGLAQELHAVEAPQLEPVAKSLVIDMFHPNVGKKMHVGHIRSGNLGEAMRRILSLKYDRVISDNHLGDWGIQFSYTIWGILHQEELDLEFSKIDLETEKGEVLSDKLYQIYVAVNQFIEKRPEIRHTCQKYAQTLELGLQEKWSEIDTELFAQLHSLYQQIVEISLRQYHAGEEYLNLNQNPEFLRNDQELFDSKLVSQLQPLTGCHQINPVHQQGTFDLVLGESFYISFVSEFEFLVEKGLATQEGQAIYVDLSEQKLGRCYLISSEGYSLYHSRDIINRLVYAGLFGFEEAISLADLRQEHSFLQVFAVLQKIMDSGIYKNRAFGWLTVEQTARALQILSQKMAMFEGFGHLTLPEGSMSTRKGRIIEFRTLQETLRSEVIQTLKQKNPDSEPADTKVTQVAVAALKWLDLHRDREQDVVFDLDKFLKFEGNTGIYQLYTIARLSSILDKYQFNAENSHPNISKLNDTETFLLKQTFTLPLVLEKVAQYYKPHWLCNHLFEVASEVNSWYSKYSVSQESDPERQQALLALTYKLKHHLWLGLELLGIEPLEEL